LATETFRSGVFVSYSHADREWLNRLRVFLAPYMRGETIRLWDDTHIEPGADWQAEITKKIACARVAVLLVTPYFLASDYVFEVELPLLQRETQTGLTILWIAVRHSAFQTTPLRDFQAANDPSRPLAALSAAEQDRVLVEIADRIATAADVNALANAFRIIDDYAPDVKAIVSGKPEPETPPPHSVIAKQHQEAITFAGSDSHEVITAEDLKKLDADEQKLIRAYELTMKQIFDRWIELKPKRYSQDSETRREARQQSDDVRRDLCAELVELLDFIETMGKRLHDHYRSIRFVCRHEPSGESD
jgi:hypothetical protein